MNKLLYATESIGTNDNSNDSPMSQVMKLTERIRELQTEDARRNLTQALSLLSISPAVTPNKKSAVTPKASKIKKASNSKKK